MKKPKTYTYLEGQVKSLEHQLEQAREDAASSEVARSNAVERMGKAENALASLQKQIADGKIWNVANARITPRAQAAIALAHKEAQADGATYIGTEHVLLGLLKQEQGIAQRIFIAAGLTYKSTAFALRVSRCS